MEEIKKRVVIVGGGFGGVAAAKPLRRSDVDIALIDRRNYHLFQPLLYQVATAALNPSDIAAPIRRIFRSQKNISVLMGEVVSADLENQLIVTEDQKIRYDYLVMAAGATHSYFGNDQWSETAPGLKKISDATKIRKQVLLAFESAEMETDPEAREACLTFVVIGAGPTGCELAGAMAEIAGQTIPKDFRHVDTTTARVILIEAAPRVLGAFPEKSSESALRQLEELGVEVLLNQMVTDVTPEGVSCGDTFYPARNVLWAAGVKASPIGETLGVELDRAGRVIVEEDLSVPGHPNVFVIGDQAAATDPKTEKLVPGVAQGAMQGGEYVGKLIREEVAALARGNEEPVRKPFSYFDKGNMATIGKHRAVADVGGFQFGGYLAWLAWALVHIVFLIDFRSKVAVGMSWAWTYLFTDRGARLITGTAKVNVKQPPDLD
ncbi:MAG: NAD(P)/FAD-dependent oxidoreductase [Verrucomicrobiales bacterium]|nr:NAD(P)/FAD-dependent oxidoreductase [Verrucomicrobiales bacterium]